MWVTPRSIARQDRFTMDARQDRSTTYLPSNTDSTRVESRHGNLEPHALLAKEVILRNPAALHDDVRG